MPVYMVSTKDLFRFDKGLAVCYFQGGGNRHDVAARPVGTIPVTPAP